MIPVAICMLFLSLLRSSKCETAIEIEICENRTVISLPKDALPSMPSSSSVQFDYGPGISSVYMDLVSWDASEPSRREANLVVAVPRAGIHHLTVFPILEEDKGETRMEAPGNYTTYIYVITKRDCHHAATHPRRINNTHAEVTCGAHIPGYSGKIKWVQMQDNETVVQHLENRTTFTFNISDPTLFGNYHCIQRFPPPTLAQVVRYFTIGPPVQPQTIDLICRGNQTEEGSVRSCVHPAIILPAPRDFPLDDIAAFNFKFQGESSESKVAKTILKPKFPGIGKSTPIVINPEIASLDLPGVISVRSVNTYGLESPETAKLVISAGANGH